MLIEWIREPRSTIRFPGIGRHLKLAPRPFPRRASTKTSSLISPSAVALNADTRPRYSRVAMQIKQPWMKFGTDAEGVDPDSMKGQWC
jgi:hypothetical protein